MWLAGQRELAAWGCDCSCLFCCTRSTLAPTNSLGTASRTASAIAQAPGVPLRSDACHTKRSHLRGSCTYVCRSYHFPYGPYYVAGFGRVHTICL